MKTVRTLILAFSAVTVLAALLAASPGDARADGMSFPRVTASDLAVRATAQRAVVWQRNGVWEVHIQPVFDREQGGAAWVVPWPVQPTIHPGNADFFDQLELLTSPIFLQTCTEDSGGGGCGSVGYDNGGSKQSVQPESSVKVWEHGTVGQLDYVVLSAGDGDDLVAWLQSNDYEVSTDAADAITEFETEDQFFFVATLSEDADPSLPHVPVRFVLPELVDGYYPLRLTGLGVPAGKALDLTLWVIAPGSYNSGYLPESHPFSLMNASPRNGSEFDQALDDFFGSHDSDELALLYSREIATDLLADGRCSEEWGYNCVSYSELGIVAPQIWAPELQEIENMSGWIQRYQGRLDAAAMVDDLHLSWTNDYIPQNSAFYTHSTGSCPSEDDEYVGCSVARGLRHATWFLVTALILLLLGLGVHIRRRR